MFMHLRQTRKIIKTNLKWMSGLLFHGPTRNTLNLHGPTRKLNIFDLVILMCHSQTRIVPESFGTVCLEYTSSGQPENYKVGWFQQPDLFVSLVICMCRGQTHNNFAKTWTECLVYSLQDQPWNRLSPARNTVVLATCRVKPMILPSRHIMS